MPYLPSLTCSSPGLGAAFFALDKLQKSPKETRELNVLTAVGGLVDAGAFTFPLPCSLVWMRRGWVPY